MKSWISKLASLKLTVGILVVLLVVLAAGTIVESLHGTEAARGVYYAPWFFALQALFGLNLVASLIDRWPWDRYRVGFAMTHTSMVLILIGAAMTMFFKVEGQLSLWEGETKNSIPLIGSAEGDALLELPFSVRLDDFEIDVYPGTQRPAMFRSRVTVTDPASGESFPAIIEMNKELAYGGYRLFQSSYRQVPGREMTVLSVSRDPGQPIVFVGYFLLMAGMATVIGTRIVQRRQLNELSQAIQAKGGESLGKLAAGVIMGLLFLGGGGDLRAQTTVSGDVAARLATMPVQHDGRMMPFDTQARETVWKITGKITWEGWDPVSLLLEWRENPEIWVDQPVVRIGSKDLAADLGFPTGTTYSSFRALPELPRLRELVQFAREQEQEGVKLSGVLEDVLKLEGRLVALHGILQGRDIRVVPDPTGPIPPWQSLGEGGSVAMLEQTLDGLRSGGAPAYYPTEKAMQTEVTYNRVDPSRLSWWILVPATMLALLNWVRREHNRILEALAIAGLFAGFATMTWGIGMRWIAAGRIPASNMYESLLFLGWGVGLFALVASIFIKNRLIIFNATAMSALTMLLVDKLPIDRFIHPMPPVLSGTPWLAIHVPIIMVSYSVLALGVLVAHMQIVVEVVAPKRRDLVAKANDLLYWYMHVGSLLLIAGILTGSIWAASSWGRYWGWDPKEVWSLVAFLAYMAIVHGKFERLIGPFGVAVASIGAFWTILMTYIGVNYVLAAGLHSYGAGGSEIVRTMVFWLVIEMIFLAIGFVGRGRGVGGDGPNPLAVEA